MRKNTALMYCISWKCVRCSSGSRSKGNKTETFHWTLEEETQSSFLFFPSVNIIEVNITVTPKLLPSVWRHQTRSDTLAGQSVGVDWGGEHLTECLLSAVLGVSSRSPTAQHLLPHSVWPTWSTRKQLLQDWPIAALYHTRRFPKGGEGVRGPPLLDPAVVPAASPVPQFFDTLAGRCNSHISGNLLPVCFFFFLNDYYFLLKRSRVFMFVSSLCWLRWSTNTGCWTGPSLFICRNTFFGQRCLCRFILCIECKRRINATERNWLSCL